MRRSRIFSAQAINFQAGTAEHELDARAAHYLRTVLRQKTGDELILFDGTGGEYLCRLSTLDRKQATAELLEFDADNRAPQLELSLGLGISRGDRMDYALQKATELGVRVIQPLTSQHGDAKIPAARQMKRQAHWQGIICSACEQCGLNLLPRLAPIVDARSWGQSLSNNASARIVLHPEGEPASLNDLAELTADNRLVLTVGPEGGFSDDEIAGFQDAGFRTMALGPRVLRTETAPVALLSILQFIGGDLSGP